MNASRSKARRLVVLVPGFYGRSSQWTGLIDRFQNEPGYRKHEAQWLPFDHGSSFLSAGGIRKLAMRLQALINAEWESAGGYDDVVLVGHSMGGPLVREAYLLGAGAVSEVETSDWTRRVSRFVLLASVNRGVDPKRVIWLRPSAWLSRHIPLVERFRVFDIYRGSAFLTNLRINWIRHFGALAAAERAGEQWPDGQVKIVPRVIQLLGTEDGLVSRDDSKDILAFKNGHELTVPDANHRNIFRCDTVSEPKLRYAVIRKAFCDGFGGAASAVSTETSKITRVVFLLHGIRASNVDGWIKGLEASIKARDPQHTLVKHPTYGYFSAARFIFPSVRRRNIAVFQDWYTEVLAEHPTAEFSMIAHSNGTYILGHSVLATPGMRFANVVLAGSVLPRNFWQRFEGRLKNQIGRIRNDRANDDFPVGILCSALRAFFARDIGSGGFAGFIGDATLEVAYYQGGHSAALNPDSHDSMIDFIFGQEIETPNSLSGDRPWFARFSRAAPVLAALIVLGLMTVAALFIFYGQDVGGWQIRALIVLGVCVVIFYFLDIF